MRKIIEWDTDLLLWIQDHLRNETLTPVMKFVTHLGDVGFIWILAAVVLISRKKMRVQGLVMAGSMTMAVLFNNLVLKNIVYRTRPYEVIDRLQILIQPETDPSFPSGHTCFSFAAAVVVWMLLPLPYGILAMALAFSIGFSRVYLGMHYPLDVIAGMLVGIACAVISVEIYKKWKNQKKNIISKND